MAKSDDEHWDECVGYCRICTDAQLRNIYADETQRLKDHGDHGEDSIGRVAKLFARAAKTELERRELEP